MSSIAQPVARSVSRSVLAGQRMNLGYLIRSMFSNSEQGFAYDINDLSTLFQDAAGTMPVTGAGQPVGLVLDKSKGLFVSAIDSFDDASVGLYRATRLEAGHYNFNIESGWGAVDLNGIGVGYWEVTVDVTRHEGAGGLAITGGSGTAVLQKKLGLQTLRIFNTRPLLGVGNNLSFVTVVVPINVDFKVISVRKIAGNHAYQTTSASRPLLQRNATTGAYYLAFDGTDDFLVTNSIDFTATDKVSLFAGVRKLSDAATGCLVELSSASYNSVGSFSIFAPSYPDGKEFFARSSGTLFNSLVSTNLIFSAPISAVLTVRSEISKDNLSLKANKSIYTGIQDQGTGNYGNYPLYIGRRGGTSLPFNGHLYSLVGVGRLTTNAETINLEKAIAKNVGVTL